MPLLDADVVWIDDFFEATFLAEKLDEGFLLSIVFDDFPFESVERANHFLRHNDVGGTITVLGNIPVYHTLVLGDEDQIEDAARDIARRLKWQLSEG